MHAFLCALFWVSFNPKLRKDQRKRNCKLRRSTNRLHNTAAPTYLYSLYNSQISEFERSYEINRIRSNLHFFDRIFVNLFINKRKKIDKNFELKNNNNTKFTFFVRPTLILIQSKILLLFLFLYLVSSYLSGYSDI